MMLGYRARICVRARCPVYRRQLGTITEVDQIRVRIRDADAVTVQCVPTPVHASYVIIMNS